MSVTPSTTTAISMTEEAARKIHALLAEDGIKAAITDWKKRRQQPAEPQVAQAR